LALTLGEGQTGRWRLKRERSDHQKTSRNRQLTRSVISFLYDDKAAVENSPHTAEQAAGGQKQADCADYPGDVLVNLILSRVEKSTFSQSGIFIVGMILSKRHSTVSRVRNSQNIPSAEKNDENKGMIQTIREKAARR